MSNEMLDQINIQSDEENSNNGMIDSNILLTSFNSDIKINEDDFESKVLAATTSQKLINLLDALPRSVFAMGQSHTYNRVIKLLVHENILETLPRHSWNRANKREKQIVINALKDISKANYPELFARLQAAILNKDYKRLPSSSLSTVDDSSVLVNRIILLAHAIIDPILQPTLTELAVIKVNSLDFKTNKLDELKDKAASLASSQAPNYSNIFLSSDYITAHPDLNLFNPSAGSFQDGEQFYKLLIIMKNKYEKLLSNISQWSTNTTSSTNLDSTALECCATGRGTYDYPLFYCYMLWKDKDIRYITANLSSGIDDTGGRNSLGGSKRPRTSSGTATLFHKKSIPRNPNDNDYDTQTTESDNNPSYFIPNTPFSVNDSSALQAYIEKKKAQTNYLIQRTRADKEQNALKNKEKEIEILKSSIADRSFELFDEEKRKTILDKYYLLLMNNSQINDDNDENDNNIYDNSIV